MPSLALFDFDGTITYRDTFADFVARSISRRRLLIGRVLLAPLVVGYKLGLVSGQAIRAAIVRIGYPGAELSRLQGLGARYASEVLSRQLRPQAMERIRWHRQRGDTIVVVSAALDVYLAPWCREHGLDYLCSSLEARDGRLTGRYAGAQCAGPEKPRRVQANYALSGYDEVYAYGDTSEDYALLAIASHASYRWQAAPELCAGGRHAAG